MNNPNRDRVIGIFQHRHDKEYMLNARKHWDRANAEKRPSLNSAYLEESDIHSLETTATLTCTENIRAREEIRQIRETLIIIMIY